jgi:hypothetical protein
LPDGELERRHCSSPGSASRGELSIYFAPFAFVNEAAHLALVGIMPGFMQMQIAYRSTRDELRSGATLEQASRAAFPGRVVSHAN